MQSRNPAQHDAERLITFICTALERSPRCFKNFQINHGSQNSSLFGSILKDLARVTALKLQHADRHISINFDDFCWSLSAIELEETKLSDDGEDPGPRKEFSSNILKA